MEKKRISIASPGRINLIGEHTDYHEGFVLPAAIDKKTIVHFTPNDTPTQVHLTAENVGERFSFDLAEFSPLASGWPNYIMGVVHELQQLGAKIEGFDAIFSGNVPIGAGMSSSAALSCSFAYGLNELFDLGFDTWQLIKAAQMAEHHFVGIKCGIMDQFASMMGKKDHVMLLDCRSLEFEYFPLQLGEYQILLLNSHVSHSLADSAYNARREQSESGIQTIKKHFSQIKNLRDVDEAMLAVSADSLDKLIFKRCKHPITENARVLQATQALKSGDLQQVGALMYASHRSLRYDYEVSCAEIDFLVDFTKNRKEVLGSRIMGGGFGGCTINIIQRTAIDSFAEQIAKAYRQQFSIDLLPYEVEISSGTDIIIPS